MIATISSRIETNWPPMQREVEARRPRLFTHWRPSLERKLSASQAVIGRPTVASGSETNSTIHGDPASYSPSWSARTPTPYTRSSSPSSVASSIYPTPESAYSAHDKILFGRDVDDVLATTESFIGRKHAIAAPVPSRIWGDVVIPNLDREALYEPKPLISNQTTESSAHRLSPLPAWDIITYLRD